MKWYLTTQKKGRGTYYVYKRNYAQGGISKSDYVYLGTEEVALKILSDFASEKPLNERLLSFSGEILLSKALEVVDLKNVINKIVQNGAKFDVGRFVEVLVVERAIYEYSKWKLANVAHEKSFFSLDAIIPSEKFYENNIYHYMDYIYPKLDQIQNEIVKNLLTIKDLEFNELIIDATSVHCFGSDEVESPKNQIEKYKQVNRTRGYSRSKRPDLPQINLILSVNACHIPLVFDAFSGNAPDTAMFKMFLDKCQRTYPLLLKRVKGKYLVFDKGNNSKDNIKEIDDLCDTWECHFVASVRPSLVKVKKKLAPLKIDELPILYEQKKTKVKGKTDTIFLYKKERNVLLYANEEIADKERRELLETIHEIQEKVEKINQKRDAVQDKLRAVEILLRKNRLFSFFTQEVSNDVIHCAPIPEKLEQKLNLSGKFAIITNDFSLDAASIVRIYKTAGVIEQDFHVLKSVLSLYPLKHRKKERIKVHCALVIWGATAFAILKHTLKQHNIDLTFEEWKDLIKEGFISIGDYVYPKYKSFQIQRTLNFNSLLKRIFKILELNCDYFNISVLPTLNEKKERKNQRRGELKENLRK